MFGVPGTGVLEVRGAGYSGWHIGVFAVRGFGLRVRVFPLGIRGFGGTEFRVQGYAVRGFGYGVSRFGVSG